MVIVELKKIVMHHYFEIKVRILSLFNEFRDVLRDVNQAYKHQTKT